VWEEDAMREQLQDRLAYRTVAVRLPNGETEYWLTDQVFAAGDRYKRNGHTWEVTDVLPPTRNGRSHLTVRLSEGDA
jgi:hypothetical protein